MMDKNTLKIAAWSIYSGCLAEIWEGLPDMISLQDRSHLTDHPTQLTDHERGVMAQVGTSLASLAGRTETTITGDTDGWSVNDVLEIGNFLNQVEGLVKDAWTRWEMFQRRYRQHADGYKPADIYQMRWPDAEAAADAFVEAVLKTCYGEELTRTIIRVEVLSQGPYEPETLGTVAHDIVDGDVSGDWEVVNQEILSKEDFETACRDQGSDPSFFFGSVDDEDETDDAE